MMRIPLYLFISVLMTACAQEPQPIDFGHDQCHYCKMTIADKRYGGEIVTQKGKVYKYDAVECMISSVFKDQFIDTGDVHSFLVIDFGNPGNLIDAKQCSYLQSDDLPSPMGMFLTAVSDRKKLSELASKKKGQVLKWNEIIPRVINHQLPER